MKIAAAISSAADERGSVTADINDSDEFFQNAMKTGAELFAAAIFIVVCSRLPMLELSAFCTCRPKHIESVTTAKASAVFFIVFLFSFGN